MTEKWTRREFVRTAAGGAVAASALSAIPAGARSAGRRPNVLLIVLDDLGAIDANCYGAKDLQTPNLDALAASGVRFTQLCSAAPICSASRAAILTGRYPVRAGLPSNASSRPGGHGLPADEIMMSRMFRDAGYATGHVGKWHLGYADGELPNQKGFEHSFGHMGGCIDNYSHYFFWDGPDRHDLWENGKEVWREGQNFGDLMVAQCNQFLETRRDRPFFLYWAINLPHYPLQGRAKWRERYRNLPSPRNMYAASVSSLDELIGQVMTRLRDLGLADNTIVALQTDHGHSTEDRSFGGGGNAGPYRGAKFSLFEGGIRMVSMLSGPGIPRGKVCDEFVTGCDWLPTFAELCDVPVPKRKIDGMSMLPVILPPHSPTRHPVFHWQLGEQWAVREGSWKLIGNPRDTSHKAPIGESDKLFLSDLAKDVTEMTNLASGHPDIVRRLTALHRQWVRDVKDRA